MNDEQEAVPWGHRGGPPLYGRMMRSISSGHDRANRMRMLKLPLIFTEARLYAGAIAQFYWLSDALEAQLRRHAEHPMVATVAALGLCVTPGYASDLKQLYGEEWLELAAAARTPATASYVAALEAADPVSLVAAAFILYGALVVGGGKATQAKVRRVLPGCDHQLFDVAEDMQAARRQFKACFTAIGQRWPEHCEALEREAAAYMARNNAVVVSVRCWGRAASAAAALAGVVLAVALYARRGSS